MKVHKVLIHDVLVNINLYLMLLIINNTKNRDGSGGDAQIFEKPLLRSKAQIADSNLFAKFLDIHLF